MLRCDDLVTVVGGTGFVGRRLVDRLLAEGLRVRIVARYARTPADRRGRRQSDRRTFVAASLTDPWAAERAADRAWGIVNLAGTTTAKDEAQFHRLHCDGPARLARAAARGGVTRLIHVSAMGANLMAPALADRSKAAGELAVEQAFPRANIVRPALIFGEGDHFFTRFESLTRRTRLIPLIDGGRTRFQPIFIDDFVEAVMRILADPETAGRTYELGGSEIATFRELIEKLCAVLERRPLLVNLPIGGARFLARTTQWLPAAPVTVDQVRLLETDKVKSATSLGPAALGMTPQSMRTLEADLSHRFRNPAC